MFAYVSFTNDKEPYISMMKITISSVLKFSKFPILVYLIDVNDKNILKDDFKGEERVKFIHVNNKNFHIFVYKPFIILDAIERGYNGYYIEADDIITPKCDSLFRISETLEKIPISPIHPDDVIPYKFLHENNITKTQHYIHAHVLFNIKNKKFIEEWFQLSAKTLYENYDETALNGMYWKEGCTNHYLPIVDPYWTSFYETPESRNDVCTYHGHKDYDTAFNLYVDMCEFYEVL